MLMFLCNFIASKFVLFLVQESGEFPDDCIYCEKFLSCNHETF